MLPEVASSFINYIIVSLTRPSLIISQCAYIQNFDTRPVVVDGKPIDFDKASTHPKWTPNR
jgi:hypothetical protein